MFRLSESNYRGTGCGKAARPDVCPAKAGVFRGIKPSRVKVGSPLAWVAVVEEMKLLKSTDEIFFRRIASYQAVMKMNAKVASIERNSKWLNPYP
jgi:hypothetical protein